MNKLVRSFTFRGLPIFVAVFVAFGVGSATRADIGFAQAVATARLVYPNQTLVALERDIGDPTLYATGSVSADATLLYGLGIHAINGAVIAATVESVKPPEDAMMLDVLARMPLVTIDFAQALTRARAFTGRSDLLVADISLASELFMLFYDLRYTDGVRLMVDAITGQVVPVVETSTSANSISPLAFSLATSASAADSSARSSAGDRSLFTLGRFTTRLARTPKRCSSSMMTRPRSLNCTSLETSRCVPITICVSPSRRRWIVSFCS